MYKQLSEQMTIVMNGREIVSQLYVLEMVGHCWWPFSDLDLYNSRYKIALSVAVCLYKKRWEK